jgi:PKD repeat protein
VPLTVQFTGSTQTDPQGTRLVYAWTFGDGTSATGATVAHTYEVAGTFTSTLSVFDGPSNPLTATTNHYRH